MKSEKLINKPLYHYKYSQTEIIDVFVEKRTRNAFFNLSKGYSGHIDWDMKTGIITLAAVNPNNFFKNENYKINRKELTRNALVNYELKNNKYYVELIANAGLTEGKTYYAFLDIELNADEFKHDVKTTNIFSDLFEIEGINFSIILPVQSMTTGRNIETSAVLTLILNGIVSTIDPYTFKEDDKLKKLNSLPYGTEKIEILFQLKKG